MNIFSILGLNGAAEFIWKFLTGRTLPQQQIPNNVSAGFEKFLVDNGFINSQTADQLRGLEQRQRAEFEPIAFKPKKLLDEEELAKAKAAFFNIPYADLKQLKFYPRFYRLSRRNR